MKISCTLANGITITTLLPGDDLAEHTKLLDLLHDPLSRLPTPITSEAIESAALTDLAGCLLNPHDTVPRCFNVDEITHDPFSDIIIAQIRF